MMRTTKRKPADLSRRYLEALRERLLQVPQPGKEPELPQGFQAQIAGLRTLDLARLHEHEQVMVTELLPACPANKRAALHRRAARFFADVIAPIGYEHHRAGCARMKKAIAAVSQRTVELAASNQKLSVENARRKAVESELKQSERHYSDSLKKSDLLKDQLRRLSRQMLSSQEDERKKISRDLHAVIAQALTATNVRLANLKTQAALNTRDLSRNIAATQRIVLRSVETVLQFARELRPLVLDDLGLIPALHSYIKHFMSSTGIRTRMKAFEGADQLRPANRTSLYRVAQEALTNVVRHAHASSVDIDVLRNGNSIHMRIHDDGVSFEVHPVLLVREHDRLGPLGMRERVEMVGGSFDITSAPGKGTTITADVPCGNHKTPRQSR